MAATVGVIYGYVFDQKMLAVESTELVYTTTHPQKNCQTMHTLRFTSTILVF